MKKTRILGIAPYKSLATLMKEVSLHYPDIELTVEVGDLEDGLKVVETTNLSHFDFIVSRGGTAQLIRKSTFLPIIEIEISVYDVLRAIQMAEGFSANFAIVGYPNITKYAHILCDLLQYKVEIYTINSYEATRQCMLSLKSRNVQHVLCDMVSQRAAMELDMSAILITSGVESIAEAFDTVEKFNRSFVNSRTQLESVAFSEAMRLKQQYLMLFNEGQTLVFSTLPDDKVLTSRIKKPVFTLLETAGYVKWEHTYDEMHVVLEKSDFTWADTVYRLVTIHPTSLVRIHKNQQFHVSNKVEQSMSNWHFKTVAYLGEEAIHFDRYCKSLQPTLICGELGCGKTIVAEMIYSKSVYQNKPLYTVDFSSVQERSLRRIINNISSPLHGTGQTIYFKNVDALTLTELNQFLNYISESRLAVRNRLILSFEITPQQGTASPQYKAITDTLPCQVLYLRPLRARTESMQTLTSFMISRHNLEFGRQVIALDPSAMEYFLRFPWYGNLNQLSRVLQELVSMTHSSYINGNDAAQILSRESANLVSLPENEGTPDLSRTLAKASYDYICRVLSAENMNQSRAAKRLGISRSTLWRMLKSGGKDQ